MTIDGQPFSSIEDEGVVGLSKAALKALDLKINRKNIVFLVAAAANEIKREIAATLKHTLASIKIDAVSRMNRCFLGINIQVSLD